MKRFIQVILFFLIILIFFVFYKTYFDLKENDYELNTLTKENLKLEKVSNKNNNIIKNLKYEVNLVNGGEYIINSDLSEILYIDGVEIVSMKNVFAKYVDDQGREIKINSEKAFFLNSNYNTKFEDNIIIEYLDNNLFGQKLDLNFEKNTLKIYQDVIYNSKYGIINADNIEVDLISKKISIFMNNSEDKVKISSN